MQSVHEHVVTFLSADMLGDILSNPTATCLRLGISKAELLHQQALLPTPEYEQDVITEYGCGTGLFLSSLSPAFPAPTSLEELLTGKATFSPRSQEKKDTPAITVIMPTMFRDISLLNRALKSVIDQSYTNWRVLVVGDGILPSSIPFSPEVDEAIGTGKIVITKTGHPGLYPPSGMERWHVAGREPLNFGIAVSSSPIIARLDDDDYWLPSHLSLLVNGYAQIDGNALIYTQPCRENGQHVFTENESWRMLPESNVMFSCCAAYCGSVIGDMKYDEDSSEPGDWRLYKKLLAKGHPFLKLPEITSMHSSESHQDGRI